MNSAAISDTDDRLINIDVLGALNRRKWIGIAVGLLGVAATSAIVATWPSSVCNSPSMHRRMWPFVHQ